MMGGISHDQSTEKPGDVKMVAANAIPYGWIKANGAAISRATYAALFAAIGTIYGAGDGVSTFNLPDLRGEFIRCFDDARGVDSGRAIGSAQAGAVESHTHVVDGNISGGGGPIPGFAWNAGSGAEADSDHATQAAGGTETRPRNVAMLAVIKY